MYIISLQANFKGELFSTFVLEKKKRLNLKIEKKKKKSKIGGEIAKKKCGLRSSKEIVYSQIKDFMLFLGIKTLEKCHTKKKKKIQKAYSALLYKRFFFKKSKDSFWFKTFLQHKEQEPDENILNFQL